MFGSYSSSLNAVTLAFASALESTGVKVNAACPGFTATDLNNFQGAHCPTGRTGARAPRATRREQSNGHLLE
jgi:NAD(P)-dependent dehydrogenase (short-subunit alcohol dehydrogenase family)